MSGGGAMPSGGSRAARMGWRGGVLLSLASAALFLLLLEGGARLLLRLRGDRILTIPARYYWENTPGMRKVERGIAYEINSLGFRGSPVEAAKPPGTVRVVCLGDSSTFGFLNREGECYPRLLGECLSRRGAGARYEVVNAGVSGYTTLQQAIALKLKVLPLDPDVVVIQCGHNNRSMAAGTDRSGLYRAAGPLERWAPRSGLLRLLSKAAGRLGRARGPGAFDPAEGLRNVRGDLSLMIDVCRQHGARVIVLAWGQQPEVAGLTEEGIDLYEKGRLREAAERFERAAAVEYNWDWRPAHYLRLCYLAAGEREKARRAAAREREFRTLHPWVVDERPYLDAFRDVASAKGVPLLEYRGGDLRPSLFLDICHPSPEFTRRIAEDLCRIILEGEGGRVPSRGRGAGPPAGSSSRGGG